MDGRFLFLLTVLMEFASSLISFLVGYYAIKSYRASSVKGLFLLYLGFIVLGIGNFLRAVTATYFAFVLKFVESPAPPLASEASWIHLYLNPTNILQSICSHLSIPN